MAWRCGGSAAETEVRMPVYDASAPYERSHTFHTSYLLQQTAARRKSKNI